MATQYINSGLTVEGPINFAGTDTGSGNAFVAANPSGATIAAYRTGAFYAFKASHANTAAATLAIDGLTATTIKKQQGAADLASGDIASGAVVVVQYDGTNFQMQSTLGNAGGGGSGITALTGDVTASGSGSVAATAVKIPPGVTLTGTPSSGQVPTATSSSAATWQTPSGGGGATSILMSVPVVQIPGASGTPYYIGLTPSQDGTLHSYDNTESNRRAPLPIACTLSDLTVSIEGAQPGDGSMVITLRQWTSGTPASTTLTVTIPASAVAGGVYQDITHSYAFAALQYGDLMLVNNSGSPSAYVVSVSFKCAF